MHKAKQKRNRVVEIWGSGKAKREFIYVEDLSDACIFVMVNYEKSNPINAGTGIALTIKELAQLIMDIVGYNGTIKFDNKKPDGMPEKILDSKTLFKLGWNPKMGIHQGLEETYNWYQSIQY